jgi:hypothetical protein
MRDLNELENSVRRSKELTKNSRWRCRDILREGDFESTNYPRRELR